MKTRTYLLKPLVAAALLCAGAAQAAPPVPVLNLGELTRDGAGTLNPFSQISPLHNNAIGQQGFDYANNLRRATGNIIPTNDQRPDLPGLRKDATSRLVHSLKLYEASDAVLIPIGAGDGS
ncbi:MAG TPA: hypothetical protein VJM31_15205 [Vicinamibacterales bacterium]|nr:hypothetical protein [Vicinamibacterales bacterium]